MLKDFFQSFKGFKRLKGLINFRSLRYVKVEKVLRILNGSIRPNRLTCKRKIKLLNSLVILIIKNVLKLSEVLKTLKVL